MLGQHSVRYEGQITELGLPGSPGAWRLLSSFALAAFLVFLADLQKRDDALRAPGLRLSELLLRACKPNVGWMLHLLGLWCSRKTRAVGRLACHLCLAKLG